MVAHEEQLLMVERKGADGDGTWSVPGGWMQWDLEDPLPDDAYATAVSETREETGVWVDPFAAGGFTIHVMAPPSPRAGEAAVTLFVICRYLTGEPHLMEPDKAATVCWVPLDAVVDRPLFDPLAQWWSTNGDYLRAAA